MIRKRYEVRGMMEWHTVFKAGRTRLNVSFTGGHLCGGANTPATYETSDPVVQAVIEGSEAFRSGRVRLGAVTDMAPELSQGDYACGVAVTMTGPNKPSTVMEFDDLVSAGDFLQAKKGVPVDRVLTLEQCMKEAESLGIELKIKKRGEG